MTSERLKKELNRHPVILFDGVCNLCTGSVQFVIERDTEGLFRFASLQSDVAKELLEGRDINPTDLRSVVLVERNSVFVKSDAVLRVARQLGGPYRMIAPLRYLPRDWRDMVYDFVAERRYSWFGKRDDCLVPTPELKSRFLTENILD